MINKIKNKTYALLRSSEKWTKTDMVYLASGSFWLSLGKIAGGITGFLLAIVYANFLSKEEYATYKYLLSLAGIFSIFTLPGIETSLINSIAKNYDGSYRPAILARFKWSVFGGVVAVFVATYYYLNGNASLAFGLTIVALSSPIINNFSIMSILQGKKLWKTTAAMNTIKTLVTFTAIAATAIFIPKATPILFASYLATTVLQLIFYFYLIRRQALNDKVDDNCIPFGKHLSLMSAFTIIAENVDKVIIWKFLGAAELAIYSFAHIPINQFTNFMKSISVLAFPKIAQQKNEILKKTLGPKIIKLPLFIFIPTISYILLAPFFFKVFFPEYLESVKYSQVLAIFWLFFPQRFIYNALVANIKTKQLYILNIAEPILKILLYIILIPIFHIYGAIIAILASSVFNMLYLSFFFKKL